MAPKTANRGNYFRDLVHDPSAWSGGSALLKLDLWHNDEGATSLASLSKQAIIARIGPPIVDTAWFRARKIGIPALRKLDDDGACSICMLPPGPSSVQRDEKHN